MVCRLIRSCLFVCLIAQCTGQIDLVGRCETCREVVKNFQKGLVKTAKSNFGGGNTHWEEKNLGSYAFSETRLLEIMENLCPDKSKKECHHLVEAKEDVIENWWFERYAKGIDTNLNSYLCVSRMKVCCPNGTYGMDCQECAGGRKQPCNGNGQCVGDGTRTGSGTCSCSVGYIGELCDECSDGFYEQSNDDDRVVCKQCHTSCKLMCDGPGPADCEDCRPGWQLTDDSGCIDENECEDEFLCQEDEYCINADGSYKCIACHKACRGCTGPSAGSCVACAAKHYLDTSNRNICKPCHESCISSCSDDTAVSCDACAPGWQLAADGTGCQDIDECATVGGTKLCDVNEYCVDVVGSFKCATCHSSCVSCTGASSDLCVECKPGYHRNDLNRCVDVDECMESSSCSLPHQKCINIPGSFKCSCEDGFVVSGNGSCVVRSQGSRSSAGSKSKKTSSSSSSGKKSTSSSSIHKMPSGISKKKSPKSKAKEQALRHYGWAYVGILFSLLIVPLILRNHLMVQSVSVLCMWIGVYWFSTVIDHVVVSSPK